ncbi:MAG: outer membrane lipid asymmetry maintenance protein MlaD [Paracoccaceae bacterium]|nr:outer membrane lipid asymmetry maintenance protein MlaD [Paracoccaceae bacterium]|tara:strand:+ start:23 stop:472 length:450 start_codon:yes stop_codon:yes gene_type:complete
MSENTTEVTVGGLVLALAVGFSIFVFQITGLSNSSGSYPIYASFRSAEGIKVGTDVRLAGVKIGTVSALDLDSNTYRAASVISLKDDIRIPEDSALVISSEGLLGGNFVEVVPGASFDYLASGDEIVDTQGSVSLISLLMKFVSGGQDR